MDQTIKYYLDNYQGGDINETLKKIGRDLKSGKYNEKIVITSLLLYILYEKFKGKPEPNNNPAPASDLKQKYEELLNQYSELKNEKTISDLENSDLKSQNENLKKENKELKTTAEKVIEQKANISNTIENLQKNIAELKTQNEKLEEKNNELSRNVNDLRERNKKSNLETKSNINPPKLSADLKYNSENMKEIISKFSKVLNTSGPIYQTGSTEIEKMQTNLEWIMENSRKIIEKCSENNNHIIIQRNKKLIEENTELTKRNKELTKENGELRASNESIQKRLRSLRDNKKQDDSPLASENPEPIDIKELEAESTGIRNLIEKDKKRLREYEEKNKNCKKLIELSESKNEKDRTYYTIIDSLLNAENNDIRDDLIKGRPKPQEIEEEDEEDDEEEDEEDDEEEDEEDDEEEEAVESGGYIQFGFENLMIIAIIILLLFILVITFRDYHRSKNPEYIGVEDNPVF